MQTQVYVEWQRVVHGHLVLVVDVVEALLDLAPRREAQLEPEALVIGLRARVGDN